MPTRLFVPQMLAMLAIVSATSATGWGQRDLREIPPPDVTAERAAMKVDPAATVNLFAKDPDLSKPIQMNFDSTGGLWIASSNVYPQIRPGEVANDKIIVLRDTDGDGISDQRTVFADGLLIPTGVIPNGPHAAFVVDSTRLLYLEDTDRDGRADRQQIVLSGFGTEDTHHLVHTLRFGPDGCLYFNQSIYIHSHIDTPYGTRHLDGGGIWRYHLQTRRLEVFCKGFVNPWGHVFDHVGESFVTDGAYGEGINFAFPGAVFVSSPGAERILSGMNPGSPKHCGLEILSGTHVPAAWYGDFVTNDFRGHRVCRFKTEPSGSAYSGRQQPEIITSSHVAFRPIDAKMGPDGAIYLADWYNPIIQHGEVDFRDQRRDRTHGRIWRVSFPGRALDPWPDIASQTTEQLLDLLLDPALPIRQFARQELWQRGASRPESVLAAMRSWQARDEASRGLELVWLYEALDQPPLDAETGWFVGFEQDPAAQRCVLRSLWRNCRSGQHEALRMIVEPAIRQATSHTDPRLRLEAVASLGQVTEAELPGALDAVLAALDQEVDEPLDFAIWQTLRHLDRTFTGDSVLSIADWTDRAGPLSYAVTAINRPSAAEVALQQIEADPLNADDRKSLSGAIAIAGNRGQLGRLLTLLLRPGRSSLGRLQPLLDRTVRDKTVPDDAENALASLSLTAAQIAEEPETARLIAQVTKLWNVRRFDEPIIAAATVPGGKHRIAVIDSLGSIPSEQAKAALLELLGDEEPEIRIAAAVAIAGSRPADAIEPVIDLVIDPATSSAASSLFVDMMKQPNTAALLTAALRQRTLPQAQATELLRQVKSGGGNEEIEDAIRSSAKLEEIAWKLTPELKADILNRVTTNGSAERGQAVYRREQLQCIKCHAIGSGGGQVGPNLISVGGSSQPDYILEALLDPNAKLKEGFTTVSLLTDSGAIVQGIELGRNDEFVRLRLADGSEIAVPIETIETEKTGKSLMPEGLVDPLTKQELVDLVTFLAALGRDPDYTLSTEPILRSFEMLVSEPESVQQLRRTSIDMVADADSTLQWRTMTTKVDGAVPLAEMDVFSLQTDQPKSFIRFRVTMPRAGEARIETRGLITQSWIDGAPSPPESLHSLQLAKGDHAVVLAISHEQPSKPTVIQILGDAR